MDSIIIPQTELFATSEANSLRNKENKKNKTESIFSAQSRQKKFLAKLALLRANNVAANLVDNSANHITETFHGIDLSNVDLNNVDLTGIDLTAANLTNANLSGAILTGANLTNAKLHRTILTHATLTDVTLTNTIIDRATRLAWQQALNQQWYETAQNTIDNFDLEWEKLKKKSGFNAFETMLKQLNEWDLKNCVSVTEIVEVIHCIIYSPDTRYLVFEAAQGAVTKCPDHLLSVFNSIQGLAKFGKLINANATQQELLAQAISIIKQNLLDETTLPVMRNQWSEGRRAGNSVGTGPNVKGALAVQLALHHQLAEPLGLLFSAKQMTTTAELSDSDKKFALDCVKKCISDKEQLAEALIALPLWQLYLRQVLDEKITPIKDCQAAIDDLLKQETKKMLEG